MNGPDDATTERLWTPWRMKYIGGGAKEDGCIFCNRLTAIDDVESLILWRGERIFAIMNLFPYNTGHIMLVPNTHAADPADLDGDTLRELGERLPLFTTALRRVFGCDGFNVGLNIGAIAGAGVAEHLHQHLVPRWQGDANFMPIIARTMAIPELIPVTYGKIRAEIEREILGASHATMVLLDRASGEVLLHDETLPRVPLEENYAVWQSLIAAIPAGIDHMELAGWAGQRMAKDPIADGIALALVGSVSGSLPDGWSSVSPDHPSLPDHVRNAFTEVQQDLTAS